MGYRLISKGENGINKYKIIIELGENIYGKRQRKTPTFYGTEDDVRREDARLTSKYYHIGKKIKIELNDLTFEQMGTIYLQRSCRGIKPITKKKYKELLEIIYPIIGNIKIQKLTPFQLNNMYNKLEQGKKKIVSGSTLYEYYKVVNLVLNEAVNLELLECNPNKKVKKPKKQKHNPRFYDEEQVAILLNCLKKENIKWKTLITLTLETGCRRAEICGLKWQNVDFKNNELTIDHSLKIVDGIVYEDDPKTQASKRVIPLSESMIDLLKEYKKWQDSYISFCGNKWQDENRVFASKEGKNMHPDSLSTMFSRILKKNNLPHISFHELRHTNCSLLINSGVDPRTTSDRLGHTISSFSLERYAHSFNESKKRSAGVFNNILKTA